MRKPSKTALFEASKAWDAAAVEAAARGGSGPRTGGRSKRAHGVAFGVQRPSSLAIGEPNGLKDGCRAP